MKICNIIFYLKEKYLRIIRLFFAYLNGGCKCIICGNISYNYPVCRTCIKKYFSVTEESLSNRCEVCGKQLISTKRLCMSCRNGPILKSTNNVLPLFSYRLWNKELLYMWKIKAIRNLSFLFSLLIDKALILKNYKIIVPIPPRKGKIKKNGWDQIDEVSKILEKKYGYIVLRLLKRLSCKEQKSLNRVERIETIKNAYDIENESNLKSEFKKTNGKIPDSVCIIDDVMTTGSTIESCSWMLKNIGIKEVNVITLFIVD